MNLRHRFTAVPDEARRWYGDHRRHVSVPGRGCSPVSGAGQAMVKVPAGGEDDTHGAGGGEDGRAAAYFSRSW